VFGESAIDNAEFEYNNTSYEYFAIERVGKRIRK
jgi:hypothetical protein